jgi:hypothetical protein
VKLAAAPLPIPADERLSVVLIGSEPGFLARFLRLGLLRRQHARVAVAPRLVAVPGKTRKAPSSGTAEAFEARKEGLVQMVINDLTKIGETGSVIDVTPQLQFARETLWQIPGAQRHELVLGAITAWIPALPDGGEQLTVVELDPSPSKSLRFRQRIANPSKFVGPVDHLLKEVIEGRSQDLLRNDPGNLLLLSPDGRFAMRLDTQDKRTSTATRIIAAIEAAEKVFSGVSLSQEEQDEFGTSQETEIDIDALAAATGTSALPQLTPAQQAAERKREERIQALRAEQSKAAFPTRSGKSATIAELTAPRETPPVVPRKAHGAFVDETVAQPKFDAISLSYFESGQLDRDMASVLTSLANDPLVPHYLQKVERIDSSDSMNLKETLSIQYKDANGKSTTVHVDVPIVTRDGYMVMNGNKYSVTKQILAMPIIKVRPGEVLITTSYNKATVERFGQNASAMSSYIRLLASKCVGVRGVKVELASASAANAKFKSTVEYDDIARTVRSIKTSSSGFVFSRPALAAELAKVAPWFSADGAFGDGGHPVGWTQNGDKVVGVRADGVVGVYQKGVKGLTYGSDEITLGALIHGVVTQVDPNADVPSPSVPARKYAYSRVKMLSQYLPTAVIVGYDIGLVPMMQKAGIQYQIVDAAAYRRGKYAGMDVIKFEDAVLVYSPKRIRDSLLMNGLKELDTDEMPMSDFLPGGAGWVEHIADRLGSPGHAKALVNYQASFIDPMTKDLLASLSLPTDMAGVLIHASNMLEDNRHSEPNDMSSYRLRGPELINSILYKILHKEMERVRATRESATPQKLMVNQAEVIRQIQGASNVEEVSELNPLLEAELRGKASWTGAQGGLSSGDTVNRAMRAYHPSMKGVFGYYSPDSAEIGVKRTLAFGAAVKDVRGRFDHDIAKSSAAQLLALGELISPFTAQHSDPPRIGMQSKQATHTMPIRRHTPLLVGSGAEKALAYAIGNTYAYKALEDGIVESVDAKTQLMRVKYASGQIAYVDLSPRSVKNSGGGFFITAQLEPNPGIKPGAKFKAGDVLAHDPSYFSPTPDGGTAYKSGLLVRTAIVALDQTYEDSLMVTEKLTKDTAALVTMSRSVSLGARTNLQKVANVGDAVDPNSALAVFENVTDDADISDLLSRVGKEFDDAVAELTRNTAVSKYAGKIVEIRTYYNKEMDELSPSLQKFLKAQEKAASDRKAAAKGAPVDEPVRANAPVKITRDKMAGEVVDGVLIVFLIQVEDVAGPGDKLVSSSPLKGIISRVFEAGEEPVDESGHQVDYIMSPLSIVSRMTGDAFLSLWTNSVLVDLKQKVVDIYKE